MPLFDRLLIAPAGPDLLAAVRKATEAGGPRVWFPRTEAAPWQPFLKTISRRADGLRYELSDGGAAFLTLAWWTDHQNRRHYRVGVREINAPLGRALSPWEDDARPPLWHVYPDRVFCRTRGGEVTRLVTCGCGATGLPAEVAWMGDRCGPCHDRREEREPAPAVCRADSLSFDCMPVRGLALDARCETLAVGQSTAGGLSGVFVHLLADDGRNRLEPFLCQGNAVISSLDFSPDGSQLALGRRGAGLVILKRSATKLGRPVHPCSLREIRQAFFSPQGDLLAAVDDNDQLEVWEAAESGWGRQLSRADAYSAAFAPDGATLAVAGSSVRLLVRHESGWWERPVPVPVPPDSRVIFVGFDGTGRSLVAVGSSEWAFDTAPRRPAKNWLEVWHLPPGRPPRAGVRAEIPEVSALALSPDGGTLAWVVHDDQHSPAEVTFWDVVAAREVGRLEWDGREMLTELAFTPDGHGLVTGGEHGTVKFWPWRLLLDA